MALQLIVFLPLLAAIVAGLGGPWIGKTAAKAVTTGALFVGLGSAGRSSSCRLRDRAAAGRAGVRMDQLGQPHVDWALRLDALTAVMLVVVTTVSSLVHLYSWGDMEEDRASRGSSLICRCSASRRRRW